MQSIHHLGLIKTIINHATDVYIQFLRLCLLHATKCIHHPHHHHHSQCYADEFIDVMFVHFQTTANDVVHTQLSQ